MTDLPPHIRAAAEVTQSLRGSSEEMLDSFVTSVRSKKAHQAEEALVIAALVATLRDTFTAAELAVFLGLAVVRLAAQPAEAGP